MHKKTKTIAPKLANGNSRIPWGGRLPEPIKQGIKLIARQENKSVSWVLEEVVIRYFRLRKPDYIPRKRYKE